MLNIVRGVFFYTFLTLVFRSSVNAWSFWKKEITTPAVKIVPEAEGNFFHFKTLNGSKSAQHYIESINRFLNTYNKTHDLENIRNCDDNNPPPENSVCAFDIKTLGPCSQQNDFGYSTGSPCFYFTLSQVLNWVPIALNASDIPSIPHDLRMTIHNIHRSVNIGKNYIWLTCNGETGLDIENIGPVYYYPLRGFPTYYFPFTNVGGYQAPIVAVRLERPQRGITIFIECKVWAKNIQLDRENEIGFVKFQVLID